MDARNRHGGPAQAWSLSGDAPSLRASWEAQPWAVRILRAFLGGTFVFAGVQKFLDHGFLHAGSRSYVGSQLAAFAHGSPLGPLMRALGHAPVLAGVGIALLEIAVGLGTLLGIAPVTWATMGCGINVVLFLSATWHVHPYFLGSDSIYAVAWAAYVAGLVERARARKPSVGGAGRRERTLLAEDLSRRRFLRAAVVAAGSIALGIAGSFASGKASPATIPVPSPTRKPPRGHPGGSGGGETPPPSGSPPPVGQTIAKLDSVPIGGAIPFDDPQQGPAVLCRLSQNRVAAYSRVCTHAGCLVDFDRSAGVLYCPCHGAEFDPRHGGRVLGGPAPTPLAGIPVTIDRSTGEVVATA